MNMTSLYYTQDCIRGHKCKLCDIRLVKGENTVRFRMFYSNTSLGVHPDCFKEFIESEMELLS